MSVQETKLKAIADAIREKDGTTAPIPAADFPARILALSAAPEGLHTITVEASDPDGGTVSGGGMASDGMVLTVEATAGDGYEFSGWQEGGTTVSPNTTYTFTATMDRTLVAAFEVPQYVAGRDWWAVTLPSSSGWESVTYGDGKFVVVAYNSGKAAYSTNGATWTASTLPSSSRWESVTYGDGKFVAVAYNSGKAAYSTNGTTWTAVTLPSSANWLSVTYGDGKFVAVAGNNSNKAAYSPDGINWTAATLPSSADWQSVTYGDGKFVAVAYNRDQAAYSTNGTTWTAVTLPSSSDWRSVTYGDGKFVAVAYNSDQAAYSSAQDPADRKE